MAAARHFLSPSPSPSPSPPPWLSCRVDASASLPLDSASTATSAYQRPAASCSLAHFFPFASVCWLVRSHRLFLRRLRLASPFVAQPQQRMFILFPSTIHDTVYCE